MHESAQASRPSPAGRWAGAMGMLRPLGPLTWRDFEQSFLGTKDFLDEGPPASLFTELTGSPWPVSRLGGQQGWNWGAWGLGKPRLLRVTHRV